MIKSHFQVSNVDTKLVRHEKVVELDDKSPRQNRRSKSKQKKILVMLTAKDSNVVEEDTETMDL